MADQGEHGITWTDATWNPIRGCSRVSEGCRNCYAERVAYRFSGPGGPYEGLVRVTAAGQRQPQWNGSVRVVEEHLLDPLKWKRPRRIFVNSMSDLFHDNVTDETIDRIFAVMALCPQHTFQVLTKRPQRMRKYLRAVECEAVDLGRSLERWQSAANDLIDNCAAVEDKAFPLPNVWLGVSVENQAAADERIPLLLETSAAVRWISAEPLLGPVDLGAIALGAFDPLLGIPHDCKLDAFSYWKDGVRGLYWVVVGGESGPGARPMEVAWARRLRDQCIAAAVPFHFKQWGEWVPNITGRITDNSTGEVTQLRDSGEMIWVGKRNAGRLLDGRTWDEFPAVQP